MEFENSQIKVSVIVPVYNAERFLTQCLQSLVNQTLDHIEIICINDGSTDSSLEILRLFEKKYSNIVVIHQDNQGQGYARNRGVCEAKGRYIGFVDSDDYVEENMYELLFANAVKYSSDIVVGKAFTIDEYSRDKNELNMWNNICSGMYTKEDISKIDFLNNICSPVLWDKLIRADIVKQNLSPNLY